MGSPASDSDADADEKPQVNVTLSRGFWLGQTEVTQAQWKAVMGSEPWKGQSYVQEGADYAATYVSWDDVTEYCRKLTEQERRAGRLPAGYAYRLPTEAEWEYACRAGSTSRYSFGVDAGQLGQYAWFVGNAYSANEKYAHPVALKRANPWGLHDLHGNVWEWCQDLFVNKLAGGRDPLVTSGGSNRLRRGGSWNDAAKYCRSAYRNGGEPSYRRYFLGFRLALSPSDS